MTQLIIFGDILVCGFMIGLFAWLLVSAPDEKIDEAANIPLNDDD